MTMSNAARRKQTTTPLASGDSAQCWTCAGTLRLRAHRARQVGAQFDQLLPEPPKVRYAKPGRLEKFATSERDLLAYASALRRQPQPDLPFVLRVALAGQVTHGLHPLEQWSERARVEEQLVTETADRLVVLLVRRHQHDVLRIGQPQFVENRLVDAVEGQVRRINREAQEIVELGELLQVDGQFLLGQGHKSLQRLAESAPDT